MTEEIITFMYVMYSILCEYEGVKVNCLLLQLLYVLPY